MADEQAAVETEQTEQATTETTVPVTQEAAEATPEQVAAAASTAPSAETPKPKYMGQFDSPEHAAQYYKGQAEAFKSQPAAKTSETAKPTYTQDQLWSMRAEKLQEIASAQNAGNIDQARTAAAQVNWIDNQMLDMRLGKVRTEIGAQSAFNTLVQEGQELLKPYQADLVAGNPLNEEAVRIFGLMKQSYDAGLPIDQILSGAAVLAAAAKTGKTTAGVEMSARQEFGKAMQGALKTAVITGAGKATKAAEKTPDFLNMSDDEFRAYERKIGVRS